MADISVIKNDFLTIKIDSFGAELRSILDSDGTERLWQGDEKWWDGYAPHLFPICGCMYEGRYLYNGKSYDIRNHGFAKRSLFTIETLEKDKVVYLLVSNDETKAVYPFDFEFRVTYTLNRNALAVTYTVDNKTDGDIYFSIGSHEAYMCEGGTADYNIFFDKKETLPPLPEGNSHQTATPS